MAVSKQKKVEILASLTEQIKNAKSVWFNEFIKANPKEQKITWAASIFEGKFQDKKETETIASMPSRETLLSRLVGSMKSPISKLARFFDAAAKDIESNGKTKVWELEWKKEEVAEAPKAEETPAE